VKYPGFQANNLMETGYANSIKYFTNSSPVGCLGVGGSFTRRELSGIESRGYLLMIGAQ